MNLLAADLPENTFARAITEHLSGVLGPAHGTIAEIIPDVVPLDILVFAPAAGRDFWTFVTLGMSSRAMDVGSPEDNKTYGRAELMIGLSPERAEAVLASDPSTRDWAPIKMLKILARYPHSAGTFLAATQTVGLEGLDLNLSDAPFPAALLLPPPSLPQEAVRFRLPNGDRLNLYAPVPLRPGEFALLRGQGLDALFALLDPAGVDEVLDPDRPDATEEKPKKGWRPW